MHISKYIKIYPYREKPGHILLYSTKRASVILIRESLLKSIDDGSISPSSSETLSGLGFLVKDPMEERKQILGVFDNHNQRAKRFNAIVVMNLDCNLACKYCYEKAQRGRHYMSSRTADLLMDYVKKDPLSGGKDIHISFYGGEPLLSYDLISHISETLDKAADEKGVGCSFSIVTNGTLLTSGKAKTLASLGLKDVKITIDGPKESHDRLRPFRSGSGSFDIIIGNLKDICDFTRISLGGNFTSGNYMEFPHLLDFLLEEGITPDKLSMVKFDPVTKTRDGFGLQDFSDGCANINEPWLFRAGIFLREEILKRGYYTPKIIPTSCMVELQDDIVVNYDGAIFKCPGFLGRKGFEIGDLKSGIRDYRKSYNLDSWKKEECLDCEYLPLCFGGCRYMRLVEKGKIDGVECRKPYLDATLEAFIRQEIRYKLEHKPN